MKTTLVADKNPFKQNMLSQGDCYILDNGADNKIFVWKGSRASFLQPHVLWIQFGKVINVQFVHIKKLSALCSSTPVENVWLIHDCTTPLSCRPGCKCSRAQSSLVCCKQVHSRQELPKKYSGSVVIQLVCCQNITLPVSSSYLRMCMLFLYFSDMRRSR